MGSGSKLTMPMLVLNMGCEMLYILHQVSWCVCVSLTYTTARDLCPKPLCNAPTHQHTRLASSGHASAA
jgi:hypothetical protein